MGEYYSVYSKLTSSYPSTSWNNALPSFRHHLNFNMPQGLLFRYLIKDDSKMKMDDIYSVLTQDLGSERVKSWLNRSFSESRNLVEEWMRSFK